MVRFQQLYHHLSLDMIDFRRYWGLTDMLYNKRWSSFRYSKNIYINFRIRLESDRSYLDSNPIRLKLYNKNSTSIIQTVEWDLLSHNYLHIKNYIIWRPLVYASSSQKLDSLNKIKLDIFFDHLMYRLRIFKLYNFWYASSFEIVDHI